MTLTITAIHFVLSMLFIILLPNTVPIELSGAKVAVVGSKWVNILWAILPVIISLTMLISKNKDQQKNKLLYKRRDIFATILSYVCIMLGWILMSISDNPATKGQTITIAIKSLVIMPLALVWSIFTYRIKNFAFKNKHKKVMTMWLFYYLSAVAFAIACVGVVTKDHIVVLIIDSVFILVSILITTVVPVLYAKKIEKLLNEKPLSKQRFWVKGTAVKVQTSTRIKVQSKIKPAGSDKFTKTK